MLEIICFDICALAILIVFVFDIQFRKYNTDIASKRLLTLITVTIVAAFFDIVLNIHNGMPRGIMLMYVFTGMYHIMRCASFYLYATYIVIITRVWHKSGNRSIEILSFIPLCLIILIAVSTPVTKLFYYFDDTNMYVRGMYFPVIYICDGIYAVYALYYIIKNMPLVGKRKSMALASCGVFSLVAAYIQYNHPYLVVDILGFSLSLLYIILYVDNPGDKIESGSLLMRYRVYTEELKIAFFTLKPIDIIQIDLNNYRVLEEMLSYSNYMKLVRTLSDKLREIDSKGKYEGSLFHLKNGKYRVILEGNDRLRTEKMAQEICEALNGDLKVNEMEISVDATLFVTQCPKDFNMLDDLLSFGKIAPQYARSGEIVFTEDILKSNDYILNSSIDKTIEQGILHNKFEVFYQPIISTKQEKIMAAEALIRLRDENDNIIKPDSFIEAAELNGSIFELGEIVLRDVLNFMASDEFKKSGIKMIGINLSTIQCLQKNLSEKVLKLIDEYGVSANNLIFEVKESMSSDNQDTFTKNIKELQDAGVKFCIDNFGAGYSNITTLSTLPLFSIKLDRTFINDGGNKKHRDILESNIEMIKGLKRAIVVVGIENEEMAKQFKDYGCEYLQGNYYGMPMSKEQFIKYLEEK